MQTTEHVLDIYQERGPEGSLWNVSTDTCSTRSCILRAYGKIYRNAGAMTKGTTEETVDGMVSRRSRTSSTCSGRNDIVWTPVRRTESPRRTGRCARWASRHGATSSCRKPCGCSWSHTTNSGSATIPTASDPSGAATRHSGRSRSTWKGTVWFIEGDIKGCFDNIDHEVLLEIIRRDIHDGRLVRLIDGLLKAGYMEDWRYHDTLSGTPQGGIISPLLANIYLNELDRFVEDTLIPAYTRGETRKSNRMYSRLQRELQKARKMGDTATIIRLKLQLTDAEARRLEQAFRQATDRKLPRPPPDRPPGPPGPAPPGHRRRPGHHPPHRPALAQRLPRRRPRRPPAPQGQGARPGDPGRPGRRDPPLGHRGAGRAGARPGQLDPRGTGRPPVQDPGHLAPAARPCSGSAASIGIRLYRPTYRFLRGDPDKQAEAREELAELREKAEAGELVLLSQDEARFPMVPTLAATLGVKGHRPMVGTRDCKDLLYVFAVVNLVTAAVHTNTLESPARSQEEDRQEQDPADAGGVRRPPAARRPDLPGGASTSGWC